MSNTHNHNYYGPGANIWPAIKYLRSRGAISETTAISLEQIESEDFRELLKLNAQTSTNLGLTPDGKYYFRQSRFIIIFGIFIVIFITTLGVIAFNFFKFFLPNMGMFNELRNRVSNDNFIEMFDKNLDTIEEIQDKASDTEEYDSYDEDAEILNNEYEEQTADMEEDFDARIDELNKDYEKTVEEMNQEYQDAVKEMGL